MPCYHLDLPDGGHALVRGKLGPHCYKCRRVGEFLCDFPMGNGRTCDLPMCRGHSHSVAPGVDFCERHYEEHQRQAATIVPDEPWRQGELL